MKRFSIIIAAIFTFTIASFSFAYAAQAPAKKTTPTVPAKKAVVPEKKPETKEVDKAKEVKKVAEVLPSVIKLGNLQIPTGPIVKDLKAVITWDKVKNIVTITKGSITITFVGDSKVLVNGKEVEMSTVKNGNGKLLPMQFLQDIFNPQKKTTGQAINVTPGGIEVTPSAIEVTPSAIEVTPSAIEVTPAAIIVTPAGINVTPSGVEVTPSAIIVKPLGNENKTPAVDVVSSPTSALPPTGTSTVDPLKNQIPPPPPPPGNSDKAKDTSNGNSDNNKNKK